MTPNKTLLSVISLLMLFFSLSSRAAVVDVIIAVDRSGSVGAAGFAIEKQFVGQVVEGLKAKEQPGTEIRIGIISYASNVISEHPLNSLQNPISLILNSVNGVAYTGGESRADLALQSAADIFSAFSATSDVRHLILMADGPPFPSAAVSGVAAMESVYSSQNIDTTLVGFGTNGPSSFSYYDWMNSNHTVAGITGFESVTQTVDSVTIPAPVPEPSTWLLFGAGLFGLSWFRRSRR